MLSSKVQGSRSRVWDQGFKVKGQGLRFQASGWDGIGWVVTGLDGDGIGLHVVMTFVMTE